MTNFWPLAQFRHYRGPNSHVWILALLNHRITHRIDLDDVGLRYSLDIWS